MWHFKGKIELKKYSTEKYDSMSMVQPPPSYELWKKAGCTKVKKTPERSRALEARMAMLEAKTDNSSNESLFLDEKPKANNRNNQSLDRKGYDTRQSCEDM